MADNVTINPGSGGATVATDDVGGAQYQRVKLDVGGDGIAAPLSNANPIPISDAGGSITVDGDLYDGPTTPAASPAVATRTTGGATTIAANASRKYIWICNISGIASSGGTAGAILFLQTAAAGARRGIPLQDGQSTRLPWRTAFDLRNDSGVTAAYTIQEET